METRTIEVPATTWFALATMAEQRGVRIGDVVTDLTVTPRTTAERIGVMHRSGMSVIAIARSLGLTRAAIYYHLKG